MRNAFLCAFGALAPTLMAFGCSGIRASSEVAPGVSLADYSSFAWSSESAPGSAVDDDEPSVQVRRAVERELTERGFDDVDAADAELFVSYRLAVERKLRLNDPYFEYDTVEEYEEGTLTVELSDARTNRRVWRGEGKCRLRFVSRGSGLYVVRSIETAEPRDWRVEDIVDAIFDEFPVMRR